MVKSGDVSRSINPILSILRIDVKCKADRMSDHTVLI
jgi:hypothetical protein